MKYRKLRIAWSAAWGVVVVVLVMLWVRSYSWYDAGNYRLTSSISITMVVNEGAFNFTILSGLEAQRTGMPRDKWKHFQITNAEHLRFGTVFKRLVRNGSWWQVPGWMFVMCAAVLATSPWFRWRYSLRTLLIGMTVAAIGLGWMCMRLDSND